MRLFFHSILVLLGITASASVAADWVPAGFESLNEPQTTVVDVHYGGYFLHSLLARFNHDELTFLDPDAIVERVSDLKDPDAARALLARPLALHTDQLCHSDFQLDCGALTTDSIDIIFDRGNLRAWLFIGPELLATQAGDGIRFLPESSAELSLFNDNALYFSESGDETSFNLANNTQIAFAENRLLLRSNLTDSEGLTIDTLALSREYRGKAFLVGLFRGDASNARFVTNEHFVGASLQSSVLTRADLDQVQGTSIALFLESRSRIEIFRDGRLYSTDYYDVGNQVLNTANLPNGSYEIEIRITDASGTSRAETRFFSKTSLLPPSDQNLYFLQAGQLVDQQGFDTRLAAGSRFLRAGYTRRLSDTLGADIVVSLTEASSLVETGIFRLGKNYQMRTGLALESDGAIGFDTDLRWMLDSMSLNLNARHVISAGESAQLGESLTQISAALEMPTVVGPISLFYRSNDRSNGRSNDHDNDSGDVYASESAGVRWRSRNRKLGTGNLQASIELSRNDGDTFAAFSLNYRFGGRDSSHSFTPRIAHERVAGRDNLTELRGAMESRWQLAGMGARQLTLRADRYNQSALEAQFEARGQRGAADLSARYNLDNSRAEFYGSVSSRFAHTGDSTGIGGQRSAESAFLVSVDGVEEDVEFEVLVNGSPRGNVRAGSTSLVPVAPYASYDISLRPLGDQIINLDARSYRKTVYPGNVIAVSWQANNVAVVYGRLVDAAGQALQDALLSNIEGLALTDTSGFFQAEIDPAADHIMVQKQGEKCRAELPPLDQASRLIALGTLQCTAPQPVQGE